MSILEIENLTYKIDDSLISDGINIKFEENTSQE